jgi:hypothetical protein
VKHHFPVHYYLLGSVSGHRDEYCLTSSVDVVDIGRGVALPVYVGCLEYGCWAWGSC